MIMLIFLLAQLVIYNSEELLNLCSLVSPKNKYLQYHGSILNILTSWILIAQRDLFGEKSTFDRSWTTSNNSISSSYIN